MDSLAVGQEIEIRTANRIFDEGGRRITIIGVVKNITSDSTIDAYITFGGMTLSVQGVPLEAVAVPS